MNNKMKRYKAITLLETIIYLALFAVIFVAIIQFYFMMARNNRVAQERVEMHKIILFVNQHFSESFEEASSIDLDNSVFHNDNGVLRILTDGEYLEYSLSSSRIIVDNNGDINYLTPESFGVLSFRFEEILDSEDNNVGIRVVILFQSKNYENITQEISTSFVIY